MNDKKKKMPMRHNGRARFSEEEKNNLGSLCYVCHESRWRSSRSHPRPRGARRPVSCARQIRPADKHKG